MDSLDRRMASPSSSSSSQSPPPPNPTAESWKSELLRKIRRHEVAIAELNGLPASRAVYEKNGNIFFRKSIKSAISSEQKQLDEEKARLQKLNTV